MSNQSATIRPGMDRTLLAKLTGGLGDRTTLAKLSAALGQVYATLLPDLIKGETGLDVVVAYAGCESGLMADLVNDLSEHYAISNGALRNWSANFTLASGSAFVITLMEHMLGAAPDSIVAPQPRPLSVIELDLAVSLFDKMAAVLKSGVAPKVGFEPRLEPPYNIEDRGKAFDYPDEFAVAVRMSIALGPATSELVVIVPQATLLKTTIVTPRPSNPQSGAGAWADQISEQVRRSQVTLEARIHLQSLTLGTISRLAVGDVVPFMDSSDVRVEVSANGRDLYICEFGRAGENYTVRVKDNMNSEDELLRHLLA